MKILTNGQMRRSDEYTIVTQKIPSIELMERAGRALADETERLAGKGQVLCVCGGGNNGGDGFVCARVLQARGVPTDVVFFAERTSEDCLINKEKWQAVGGSLFTEIPNQSYSVIVDCLVGTGLKGGLLGKNLQAVQQINALKKNGTKVLSADVPSGLCGDNGIVIGLAVEADVTLCIGEIKAGVLLADGLDYAGEVKRVDIGIILSEDSYAEWLDESAVRRLLPKRKRNVHKGSFGKAAIVAGSKAYTGAAYLSAAACLRAGAGYTTLFVPENILPFYLLKAPEILLKSICDGTEFSFEQSRMKALLSYDSIAYGMGMQCMESVALGAEYLLKNYTGKLILDADGLNSLAKYKKESLNRLFSEKKCDVVLTPHCKEFSRLTGVPVKEILELGMCAATEYAKENEVTLLLKNAATVITDGQKIHVNTAGNSGQAKGGSGDVLSGVIAGLCAMGLCGYDGACAAAYWCGIAAESAAQKVGEYSLTATDVIAELGSALITRLHS